MAAKGLSVSPIVGTTTVVLVLTPTGGDISDLLGFAINRKDMCSAEEQWLLDPLRTFEGGAQGEPSLIHVHQSLLFTDTGVVPGHEYQYTIHEVRGSPPSDLRFAESSVISIQTLRGWGHEQQNTIVFNRGATASQEYAAHFNNEAAPFVDGGWDWLSKGLDTALYNFLQTAADNTWKIRACLYEFHYLPAVRAFKAAVERGVDVKLVVDWKDPTYTKYHQWEPKGPQYMTEWAVAKAQLEDNIIKRTNAQSTIQHNKFILLLKDDVVHSVWTGSTNLTVGGLFGQWNVGITVNAASNPEVVQRYFGYWQKMSNDPEVAEMRKFNVTHTPLNDIVTTCKTEHDQPTEEMKRKEEVNSRIGVAFCPREEDSDCEYSSTMLELYGKLISGANQSVFATSPFGVCKELATSFCLNPDVCKWILSEPIGPDRKWARDSMDMMAKYSSITISQGSHLFDAASFTTGSAYRDEVLPKNLNKHVFYVHAKLLVIDALTENPIVVVGSANFSKTSQAQNDENMLFIHADKNLANICLTEYVHLLLHYQFRESIFNKLSEINGETFHVALFEGKATLLKKDEGSTRTVTKQERANLHKVDLSLRPNSTWISQFRGTTPEANLYKTLGGGALF